MLYSDKQFDKMYKLFVAVLDYNELALEEERFSFEYKAITYTKRNNSTIEYSGVILHNDFHNKYYEIYFNSFEPDASMLFKHFNIDVNSKKEFFTLDEAIELFTNKINAIFDDGGSKTQTNSETTNRINTIRKTLVW